MSYSNSRHIEFEELRARYEHCDERAAQLEEQWENGEAMNGTVIQMMKRYRQLRLTGIVEQLHTIGRFEPDGTILVRSSDWL